MCASLTVCNESQASRDFVRERSGLRQRGRLCRSNCSAETAQVCRLPRNRFPLRDYYLHQMTYAPPSKAFSGRCPPPPGRGATMRHIGDTRLKGQLHRPMCACYRTPRRRADAEYRHRPPFTRNQAARRDQLVVDSFLFDTTLIRDGCRASRDCAVYVPLPFIPQHACNSSLMSHTLGSPRAVVITSSSRI